MSIQGWDVTNFAVHPDGFDLKVPIPSGTILQDLRDGSGERVYSAEVAKWPMEIVRHILVEEPPLPDQDGSQLAASQSRVPASNEDNRDAPRRSSGVVSILSVAVMLALVCAAALLTRR